MDGKKKWGMEEKRKEEKTRKGERKEERKGKNEERQSLKLVWVQTCVVSARWQLGFKYPQFQGSVDCTASLNEPGLHSESTERDRGVLQCRATNSLAQEKEEADWLAPPRPLTEQPRLCIGVCSSSGTWCVHLFYNRIEPQPQKY